MEIICEETPDCLIFMIELLKPFLLLLLARLIMACAINHVNPVICFVLTLKGILKVSFPVGPLLFLYAKCIRYGIQDDKLNISFVASCFGKSYRRKIFSKSYEEISEALVYIYNYKTISILFRSGFSGRPAEDGKSASRPIVIYKRGIKWLCRSMPTRFGFYGLPLDGDVYQYLQTKVLL